MSGRCINYRPETSHNLSIMIILVYVSPIGLHNHFSYKILHAYTFIHKCLVYKPVKTFKYVVFGSRIKFSETNNLLLMLLLADNLKSKNLKLKSTNGISMEFIH